MFSCSILRNGKTVIPFCTHEGSSLAGTESSIRSTCKGATLLKGLAVFTAAGTVCAQTSGTVNVQTAALQFNLEHRTVKLNSGYEMPVLGIGTYRLSQQQAENSVYWALKAGMRLIDTARIYAGIFRKERLSFRAVRNRLIFVKTLTFSILH
ncbi:hypothetical protein [Treponema sp.]|uniref:hypothetical protein n=1 Tax=Treponema sp. TaxID=166 RepID=UPI003FA1AD06